MYIQDTDGKMVNLNEFESIEIQSLLRRGSLKNKHRIVGRRPYIKNRDIQPIVITLGEYVCKRHAEWVYKDLMGSMGSGSTYSMPDPLAIIEQDKTDGTVEETLEYERQWEKEARGKAKTVGRWIGIGFAAVILVVSIIIGIIYYYSM